MVMTSGKGGLDRTCMKVWEFSSDERCSLEVMKDLDD
jgi:hypothetical protein